MAPTLKVSALTNRLIQEPLAGYKKTMLGLLILFSNYLYSNCI